MTRLVDDVLREVAADPLESGRPAYLDCSAGDAPTTTTYAAWDSLADAACAWLRRRGVGRGDRVCLLLPNTALYPTLYMGAAHAGAITSGMNPRLGPAEVAWIVERSEPAVVVTDDASSGLIPGGVAPVVLAGDIDLDAGDTPDPSVAAPGRTADDLVAIVWTSGTTGKPKGACFAHTQLAAVAAAQGDITLPHDRYVSAIPFAHVGFMSKLWGNLAMVTTQVIAPARWTPAGGLALIAEQGITVAGGVPAQLRMMLDHPDFDSTDLSSVRQVVLGGAAADPGLVREITQRMGCPVVSRYTCTETAIATGTAPDAAPEISATTVGKPVTGVELRLVDEDGRPVDPGEVGEVQCRSGAVMRGYWRDEAATAEVLSADGWLSTGDLGRFGDDGNLRIVGRRKEMYVRGGYNVYPIEVESRLCEHPAITQAAVVGVPDRRMGEIGIAFVVATSPDRAPDDATLREFCTAALASYKAPDRFVVMDELPMTPMSKVDKAALLAGHLPEV